MRNAYRVFVGKPEGKTPLERPSSRGKQGGSSWTGFILFRTGPVVGSCERGNKPSGSINGWEFDCLSECQLLYKDSAQWG
jgi:hypothetical protein